MTRLCSLLLLLLCGCHEDAAPRAGQAGSDARGAVVARVAGVAIGLEQVRELAQAGGLSPRDALSRLEDAVLLEQRARVGGYERSANVTRETRRALVRALLAETVEAENQLDSISEAQLQERFEGERKSLGLAAETYPQYVAALRERMVVERRRVALEKLLARLRASGRVVLDEGQVQRLLADPKLWGAGT